MDNLQVQNDNEPLRVVKPAEQNIHYKQQVNVRFLEPPPGPEPAPIIIKERQAPAPPPPPPVVIRQRPPTPPTPPPLIIRKNRTKKNLTHILFFSKVNVHQHHQRNNNRKLSKKFYQHHRLHLVKLLSNDSRHHHKNHVKLSTKNGYPIKKPRNDLLLSNVHLLLNCMFNNQTLLFVFSSKIPLNLF